MLKFLSSVQITLPITILLGQLTVFPLNIICLNSPLHAQNLSINQVRQAIHVQRENMVRAKQEALIKGKRSLVENAIMRFIDKHDFQTIKPVIEKHVLREPDRVIDSFRVIKEEVSKDRSVFTLTLEGRIFRSRLLALLRQIGLSTSAEQLPPQKVSLFLDIKKSLSGEISKKHLTYLLKNRLRPYRLELSSFFNWKGKLTPERLNSWLKKQKKISELNPIVLVVSLKQKPIPKKLSSDQDRNREVIMEFWDSKNPKLILNVVANKIKGIVQPKVLTEDLMDQLMLVWHPILRNLELSRRQEKQVRIIISGLPNPIQEQNFIKYTFLEQPKWKNLSLYALKRDFVVYRASYSGKKNQIIKEITRNMIGSLFKLKSLRWKNTETLSIDVEWIEKPILLNAYIPVREVEEFFMQNDEFAQSTPEPELMVPIRTHEANYKLPINTVIYDQIRNRGDSTTFRIDNMSGTRRLNFRWFRIGETNLKPLITLLNAKQETVKRVLLGGYKRFRFSYSLPEGDSTLFIRISEETGAIEGVTGSFNFFHYLLEFS